MLPDHQKLLGVESSTAGTLTMMNEELRQPGTARARDCQAVQCAGACATYGMDTPRAQQNSSYNMLQ